MTKRCGWVNPNNTEYIKYHDEDWGVPVFDDRKLFEMLVLEGAQAGLSWETILKRRKTYNEAFDNFDAKKIAKYNKKDIERLMNDVGIIRNMLKIKSAINNANKFLEVKKEYGTFGKYIWSFVGGKQKKNKYKKWKEIPATTAVSDAMSKDLKKRGFSFAGSTICYAYMQAVGMVNDHEITCFRYKQIK